MAESTNDRLNVSGNGLDVLRVLADGGPNSQSLKKVVMLLARGMRYADYPTLVVVPESAYLSGFPEATQAVFEGAYFHPAPPMVSTHPEVECPDCGFMGDGPPERVVTFFSADADLFSLMGWSFSGVVWVYPSQIDYARMAELRSVIASRLRGPSLEVYIP